MIFAENKYYHFYNRGNNSCAIFYSSDNYLYFLKKYRQSLNEILDTIAYCLMPTHFHFLIHVKKQSSANQKTINDQIAILLRSYTRALNKKYQRTGSLFQQKSKAIEITDVNYLCTLVHYIHQNPVRAGYCKNVEDWAFSSYNDYTGERKGTLPKMELILKQYQNRSVFIKESKNYLTSINTDFWI